MIGLDFNNNRCHLAFCLAVFVLLALLDVSWGANTGPGKPTQEDKCPVCGMFVYKYPDWTAEILFKDGTVVFFDGAKDLFKYYFDLKRYAPGKKVQDISAIYVTEYYDTKLIKADEAWFVAGSEVYGPMGRELIPLATQDDAETFRKDHKGRGILRFRDVTPKVIEKLD